MQRTVPVGITLTNPVRKFNPPAFLETMARSNNTIFSLVIISNQSASVYGGDVSGLFGLASGRATNNLNVSIIGGVFGRQPARPSVTFGLALEPPEANRSGNAGSLHWFGADPSAYDGDITWKLTTVSSNSDLATFEIDGWQFRTGGTTVTNSNQDLDSAVDPYYVNMFFPSQDAQTIRE